MAEQRFADYFVVCGLDLELVPLRIAGGRNKKEIGFRGFKDRYQPALLDHWPREQNKKFKIPEGFAIVILTIDSISFVDL